MQAIDSSWEVQQEDKVHPEFVRLVFEKQDSFEWRNLVTKDENEMGKSVCASEEKARKSKGVWKLFFENPLL